MTREALRFLCAGGIAALINWGSRFAYSQLVFYEAAVVLAYVTGMATAFYLMRRWVFENDESQLGRQVLSFVVVNLVGVVQTVIVSSVLVRWLLPALNITWHADGIAHAAGLGAPAVTSFIGHKWITFAKHAPTDLESAGTEISAPTPASSSGPST